MAHAFGADKHNVNTLHDCADSSVQQERGLYALVSKLLHCQFAMRIRSCLGHVDRKTLAVGYSLLRQANMDQRTQGRGKSRAALRSTRVYASQPLGDSAWQGNRQRERRLPAAGRPSRRSNSCE